MRRWWVALLLLAVGGLAFWAAWGLLDGPRYALYQIGKAIHDRQPRLFLAYVDVERIARGQKDELLTAFTGQRSPEEQSRIGQVVEALMGPITQELRRQVAARVADPDRENLPSSFSLVLAANVTQKDDVALVVLSEPSSGHRLRLGMARHPDAGHWQVVEINSQDLRRLLADFLPDQELSPAPAEPAPGG